MSWKKTGGLLRAMPQIAAFSDTLADCRLHDLQARGDLYTWCDMRKGYKTILARGIRMFVILCWSVRSLMNARDRYKRLMWIGLMLLLIMFVNIVWYVLRMVMWYISCQYNRGILRPQTISDWTWMHDFTARGTDLVLG